MGRFKTEVQDDKVPGPLRRAFTAERWRKSYELLREDDDDRSLFEAGLLIHEKAVRIRSQLAFTASADLRTTTKVRTFAAMVNFQMTQIVEQTQKAFLDAVTRQAAVDPDGPVWLHKLTAIQIDAGLGQSFSPDELFQSIVDGVEIPLKVILGSSPDLSGNPEMGKVDLVQAHLEYQLGGLYSHVEDLWDDCLWNDYLAQEEDRRVLFSCVDSFWSIREMSSRTRSMALSQQALATAKSLHTAMRQRGLLRGLGLIEVKAVVKDGRKQRWRMGHLGNGSDRAFMLFGLRMLAREPYYEELLSEPQSLLADASLDQLLIAWTVISQAASILAKDVRSRDLAQPDRPDTWMHLFAPVMQVRALADAIRAASGSSFVQSQALVEFLVFRGKPDQELWAQPLVPVSADGVVPVLATARAPNLSRLLDVWLKQLGVDLGQRGPAFEAHIRNCLTENLASSPLLSAISRCHGAELRFKPPGGQEEEIDVFAVIGPIVLLGEVKCLREPAEPKEVARHRQKVLAAIAQVKRKAQVVRVHLESFRQRAAQLGMEVPPNARVVPLVILNSALHCGDAIEGVPVVDEHILRVVMEGELPELAILHSERPGFQTLRKNVFFTTEHEAIQKLPDLLASPPQVAPLLKGMHERMIPIPPIDADDWTGLFQAWGCEPEVDTSSPVGTEIAEINVVRG